MTAREVALNVVRDVFASQGTARGAQEALDYRLRRAPIESRDRAFATVLAFGAIKMRRTLDWYLEPYLRERSKPVPPAIAEILRVALYELRYTAAAEHATVSEWVGLAKKFGHRGTAGLVNAVLRSFLRDAPAAPQREAFESDDDYLATMYSYPTWMVRQWREAFGLERLPSILEAGNAPAQTAVSVNSAKTTREAVAQWFRDRGAQAALSAFADDAVLVSDASLAHSAEAASGGAWWVQSESSAAVVDVLGPQIDETIVDACSGRGNKALQIAARLQGGGTLIAIERDARKAAALERRALEANLRVSLIVGDATEAALPARCDRLLIDAPCSGIGVVGRHPEARWRKNASDADRLMQTQAALLESLFTGLHEGGALVYAVCSTDKRETSDVIDAFARRHNVVRGLIPARFEEFLTDRGDVLIPPGLQGRDGFFIARLERGV